MAQQHLLANHLIRIIRCYSCSDVNHTCQLFLLSSSLPLGNQLQLHSCQRDVCELAVGHWQLGKATSEYKFLVSEPQDHRPNELSSMMMWNSLASVLE